MNQPFTVEFNKKNCPGYLLIMHNMQFAECHFLKTNYALLPNATNEPFMPLFVHPPITFIQHIHPLTRKFKFWLANQKSSFIISMRHPFVVHVSPHAYCPISNFSLATPYTVHYVNHKCLGQATWNLSSVFSPWLFGSWPQPLRQRDPSWRPCLERRARRFLGISN